MFSTRIWTWILLQLYGRTNTTFIPSTLHLHTVFTNYHSHTNPQQKTRQNKQVMKAVAVQTGYEIPNKDIATIHTLKDIHSTLFSLSSASMDASENPKGHVVAEWFQKNQSSLPPNMVFIPYAKAKGVKAEDRQRTNKRFL